MHFLLDLVILFAAALAVLSVSHRLRLPPVVGFLLTGMLVGPSGLALVSEPEDVELLAELGVVFLLFVIGLEISPERLRRLGRYLLLGGGLQGLLTIAAATGVALALAQPFRLALYYGFVITLSSTAIVLKLYFERRELESPHGRVATGILLFQDFLIVPLLLVVPVLGGAADGEAGGGAIALRFVTGFAVVAAVVLAGRYLLPPVLRAIVHTRIRELFVLAALVACLGAALLTEHFGFSLALGGFLAGMLIAETDYRHQVLAEVGSFRDVLNSVFFISVGMLLDLRVAAAEAPLVLGLAAAILLGKGAIVTVVVRLLQLPWRVALTAGIGLAQIGELSFLLIRSGYRHGLLDEVTYPVLLATAILTMMVSPLLLGVAPRLAAALTGGGRGRAAAGEGQEGGEAPEVAVVLVGFGLNGRHLARVLAEAKMPYRIIELNGRTVREAQADGEPILYGDATRREILEQAGIEHAQVAVFALSDPEALRRAVRQARELNPQLPIIARSRQLAEIEELRQCGATEVIAEELETSIEIVTRVLSRLHVPRNIVRAEARLLRADAYEMLRSPAPVEGISETVANALATGATDTFLIDSRSPAVGKSIRQLDLRRATGATVLAVVRGDKPNANPPPDTELATGDLLVLVGSHGEIDAAYRLLEGHPA